MKDPELNPLSQRQRKLLQFGVILILLVFLAGYFLIQKKDKPVLNNSVTLQDSKLQVFDDTYTLNDYSDRIAMHYPYFLVVQPKKQITYIYNLKKKTKEKEIKEIALDYFNENLLYTKGKTTYFNKQDIDVLCQKGFIKNNQEILCITKIDKDTVENKLISINLTTQKQKDIYVSKDLLTDLSVINGKVYLGEIELYTKKNYLLIDKVPTEVPNVVSMIYEMKGKPYFASFKGALNKKGESYYLIEDNKAVEQDLGEIVFYLK